MDENELIVVDTTLDRGHIEEHLASVFGGPWIAPGLRGRVLALQRGRITVTSDSSGAIVSAQAADRADQRAFSLAVFRALAANVPGRIELLDVDDQSVEVRPRLPGAVA
jgi:hypothetical protein